MVFGQGETHFTWGSLLAQLVGECTGSVVERQTPEREVGGSKPTCAMLRP